MVFGVLQANDVERFAASRDKRLNIEAIKNANELFMQINNTAIESERQQRASKVLEVYVRELIDSRKLNPSEYDGENSDILHQAWCNKRDLHKEREEFVEGMHCVGEILFYANSPI